MKRIKKEEKSIKKPNCTLLFIGIELPALGKWDSLETYISDIRLCTEYCYKESGISEVEVHYPYEE